MDLHKFDASKSKPVQHMTGENNHTTTILKCTSYNCFHNNYQLHSGHQMGSLDFLCIPYNFWTTTRAQAYELVDRHVSHISVNAFLDCVSVKGITLEMVVNTSFEKTDSASKVEFQTFTKWKKREMRDAEARKWVESMANKIAEKGRDPYRWANTIITEMPPPFPNMPLSHEKRTSLPPNLGKAFTKHRTPLLHLSNSYISKQ
jgi:hypothetical protein